MCRFEVAFVGAEVYRATLDAGDRPGNVGGEVIGGVVGRAVVEVFVVACVHRRAAFDQAQISVFGRRIGAGKDGGRFGRCHGVFLRQVGLRRSPVDLVVARTASDEVVLNEDVFFQIVDPKLVACAGVCGGISQKQAVAQGERAGLHAVRVLIGIYKSGQHAAAIAGGGVVVAGGVENGAAGTKPDAGTVRGAIFIKNTVFYQSTDRIKISAAALAIGGISGESTPGEGGGLIEVYAGTGTADDIAIERTIGDRACPIQVGTAAAAVCYLIAGEGTIGEGGFRGEKVRPATLVEGPVVHKSTLVEGGSRTFKIRPAARAVGGLIGGEDATGERGGRGKVRPGTLVFSPIVGEGTLGEGDGFGKVSTPAEIRITARVVGGIVAGEQAIYKHGARRSFACKKACATYLKFGDQSCPALATGDGEPIEGGVCAGKLHHLQAVVGAGIVVGGCIFIRSRAWEVAAEEVAGEDGLVGERAVGVAGAGVIGGVKSGFRAGKAAIDLHFGGDEETHYPLVTRGGGGVGGEGGGRVGAGFYPDLVADGGGAQGGGQRGGGCPTGAVATRGAGVDRIVFGGDPQDFGGAHGDGLRHIEGGQIVVCIATLGGGDGGRTFGKEPQNGVSVAVGADGCHAGCVTDVGNGQPGGCRGGQGNFGIRCAFGRQRKVDGLRAPGSTFIRPQIYRATPDTGIARRIGFDIVFRVVGGVVVYVAVIARICPCTVCY